MMKRFFSWALLLALACGAASCEYDDDELQSRVDALEAQVATLQDLVDALNAGKYVIRTETDVNGAVVLVFNDNTSVSVGTPGETVFFTSVVESEDAVTITTSDGRVITLPKTSISAVFAEGETGKVKAGTTRDVQLVLSHVADCALVSDNPDWKIVLDGVTANGAVLRTTAPEELTESNTTADIRLLLSDERGEFKMVKLTLTAFYDLRTLTFEDGDYKGTSTVANYWTSLVDTPQYGGPLLYGNEEGYVWYDEKNTELRSGMLGGEIFGDEMFATDFWYGGQAISNYYLANIEEGSSTKQLSVSTGKEGAAGHNGSKNFCIHFDASSMMGCGMHFEFVDGEHVVDHMWVTNTSYALNSLTYGDSFAAAGETSWFKIVATGYDAEENATGTTEFFLCKEGQIVKEWSKFDLSTLGKVARVEFTLQGSADLCGDWGLNTPAYFAYDDVTVRF